MRPNLPVCQLYQGKGRKIHHGTSGGVPPAHFYKRVDADEAANKPKANVKCTPSTPAPARKRRRPNQDLQERLARCEELLKEYATTEKTDSPSTQSWNLPTYDESYMKWQPKGKLVKEDGGVRFMDGFLLGTVYDEVCLLPWLALSRHHYTRGISGRVMRPNAYLAA